MTANTSPSGTPRQHHPRHRGFTAIELLVVLAVIGILAGLFASTLKLYAQHREDDHVASLITTVGSAAEQYVQTYNFELQKGAAIPLPGSGTVADPIHPTVDELTKLGFITQPMRLPVIFDGNFSQFLTTVSLSPAGCVAPDCTPSQVTLLTTPWAKTLEPGLPINWLALERTLGLLKGRGAISKAESPGVLTGISGNWTGTNPLNKAGLLAYIGQAGGGFNAAYVQMHDGRNPDFQGDLTVRGDITGGSVGVGKPGDPCRLGEIIAGGQILSRAANCIRRTWMDGSTGVIAAADTAGNTRISLDGTTGNLTSFDASGLVKAGIKYDATGSIVYADNLQNNAGTAGITSAGNIYGNQVVVNGAAVAGATCATENAAVWGTVGGVPTWMKCQSGVWTPVGVRLAVEGTACATQGVTGTDANGVALYCQNGKWLSLRNRFGTWKIVTRFYASAGTVVAKPACEAGAQAAIYNIPQTADVTHQFINLRFDDIGTSWVLRIENTLGSDTSGLSLVETMCVFA